MQVCSSSSLNLDSSENIAYNNKDFPVYIKKGQLSSYPGFKAVSHWHNDLEFILVLDGQMSYEVNGQKISLETNEGLFVNSHCFHYGYSNKNNECLFICIILSPSLLSANAYFVNNYLKPLVENIYFPFLKLNPSIRWQNSIINNLKELYDENKDELKPYNILEKTIHIFRLLFENMNSSTKFDENNDDIFSLTAMIGYVQKNYQNKILLKDISSSGNCCKTKCSTLFNKFLDTSPMVYLNNYRLEKSISLLKQTTMSISEIAYACGFSNSSYFCEQFHKYYNISPKRFRNDNR